MKQAQKENNKREEKWATKTLYSDTSIIILPVDKGNTSMVMNKLKNSEESANLVGYGSYGKMGKDPTLETDRKLSQILNKNNFTQNKY